MPFSSENYSILYIIPSMFSHASFFHFINNMYMLLVIGSLLEKLASNHFLYVYVLSGIIACVITSVIYTLPSLGASGAIFGLLGMVSALKIKDELRIIFTKITFSFESFSNFIFYLSILGSFFYIITGINVFMIAHLIHLIGFAVGYLYVRMYLHMHKLNITGIRVFNY